MKNWALAGLHGKPELRPLEAHLVDDARVPQPVQVAQEHLTHGLVRASVVDSAGRVVPTAADSIAFSLVGAGSLIGLGHGVDGEERVHGLAGEVARGGGEGRRRRACGRAFPPSEGWRASSGGARKVKGGGAQGRLGAVSCRGGAWRLNTPLPASLADIPGNSSVGAAR